VTPIDVPSNDVIKRGSVGCFTDLAAKNLLTGSDDNHEFELSIW
jgi:hypothetical protein